ncbi:MAG: autotransporter outer membrane beta-barrel domain-containing protein [Legionella sp.]|uniref:autotransporter outer membrane beta-barrel domain-containing protein n=1 Tax=Legionella sp. TaxID=459 RepID=UPI0039E42FBF
MKIKWIFLSIALLYNGQIACADAFSRIRNENVRAVNGHFGFFHKITPEMMYGYTDFDFNSVQTENFNRFKGHSNLYSAGADHLSLGANMMVGVYYFRIDTALASQFSFLPSPIITSGQTIKNNTIFTHLLKIFTPQLYVDVAGGYGYNQFDTYTKLMIEPDALFAHARNNNDNWFVSVNGIYRKNWQKFLLRMNLGVLYSQIDTPRYNYLFPASNIFLVVEPLTNKATLLLENAEFGYFINPKLMAFINGGLIQVAQFTNSRPLLNQAIVINGSLPQLNMNKDGFRLGAGVTYSYKNVTVRVEEKYYNASSTFHSYQTLAALEYQFT